MTALIITATMLAAGALYLAIRNHVRTDVLWARTIDTASWADLTVTPALFALQRRIDALERERQERGGPVTLPDAVDELDDTLQS